MHRPRIAAALLAAVMATGCLETLTGTASPAAEAVREAVHGRVLETRTGMRLYDAPLRLPGLCFLWSPAVPKRTGLAEGERVIVTRIRDAGAWKQRAVWLQVVGHAAMGWIRLGPDAEARTRLWSLFREAGAPETRGDNEAEEIRTDA